jgi:hypothetical protein
MTTHFADFGNSLILSPLIFVDIYLVIYHHDITRIGLSPNG